VRNLSAHVKTRLGESGAASAEFGSVMGKMSEAAAVSTARCAFRACAVAPQWPAPWNHRPEDVKGLLYSLLLKTALRLLLGLSRD
jgi:hypothetical protein